MRSRTLSLALLLAAVPVLAPAAPYAAHEFDFSQFSGLSSGFVEAVLPSRASRLEGERVLVRLDNGFSVEGRNEGLQRVEPGQRVRVVGGNRGPRVLAE